jgi:hypothetical protein
MTRDELILGRFPGGNGAPRHTPQVCSVVLRRDVRYIVAAFRNEATIFWQKGARWTWDVLNWICEDGIL